MDRVTGWYRRKSQIIVLLLALVLAIVLNVDTLAIADALSTNAVLRGAVATAATKYIDTSLAQEPVVANESSAPADNQQESPEVKVGEIMEIWDTLGTLDIPIGWLPADLEIEDPREVPIAPIDWANKVMGLLITGLLVSLGAPFWFDVLNKLANLRATGQRPDDASGTVGIGGSAPTGGVTVVLQPSSPGTPPLPDESLTGPTAEFRLADLVAQAMQYVEQLKVSGQLRLPESDVAAAWVLTKVIEQDLDVTAEQVREALRATLAKP